MNKIDNLSEERLTRVLTYAGLVLVAFELVKSLIVNPIKLFYMDTTFYYPDFIVKKSKKEVFIVETKGLEDLDVPLKIERLKQWCVDINKAQSEIKYDYVFVDEENFNKFKPKSFEELIRSFTKYRAGMVATFSF